MKGRVMERLLTPSEVANYLGMTAESLAQMRYMGEGPRFIKLNARQVRYTANDVEAWLATLPEGGAHHARQR